MKADEIKIALGEPESIEKRAFKILQSIANYVNNPKTEELGKDLVLRALEHRKKFGELSEILDGLDVPPFIRPLLLGKNPFA